MSHSVNIMFGELKNHTRSGDPFHHIHGLLRIEIDGRPIPYMGYFGEADVCFNQWVDVLVQIRKAVQERRAAYKFDEYEQGQPAFLFEVKPGSKIALSIVQSESGEGRDDPDWQGVMFSYADFKAAFLNFKAAFLAKIAEIAPQQLEFWTANFEGQA